MRPITPPEIRGILRILYESPSGLPSSELRRKSNMPEDYFLGVMQILCQKGKVVGDTASETENPKTTTYRLSIQERRKMYCQDTGLPVSEIYEP